MLRRMTLARTDVSEELSASIIRVTRTGELGTTLRQPHGVTQKTAFFPQFTYFPAAHSH
jgi:hypothetical protein